MLFILLFLLVQVPQARAQQGTGSIVGKIVDVSGAVVPGASVTITNQATLAGTIVKSDENGIYASPPLASGLYKIEVEKATFGPISQNNFPLNDDQRAELNFTLNAGNVSQDVVVQADASALNTFNATLGSVIDNATAESLPLNGSNALSMLQLDSGVVSGFGPVNDGFNDRGLGVSNIRIGGGLVGANATLLDGANNLQTTRGEILINSTITGLQETRLQYGVVPAQYGLTSGGVVTMITRAGTSVLHGQIYEFFKNGALNATNYFALKGTKPVLRYNQYGAAIGGPIKRDRAFFFGNYEAYGLTQVTPLQITVPTLRERGGDFSDQPLTIFDPTTGSSASGSRTAYQGNVIPSSEFDPAAVAFQNAFIPLPNVGDATRISNNYDSNVPLIASQTTSIGRIDWQATSRTSLFARYAYYENITNNEGNYGSLALVASTRKDDLRNQDVTIGITQNLSDTLLNDIRIAVGRSYFPFSAASSNQNWPQQLGLANVPSNTLPAISVTNYGITVATNQGLRTSLDPEVNDLITLLRGPQSFHIGAGFRFNESYNNSNTAPSGSFSFSPTVTGQTGPTSSSTGNAYASFLIGKPGSVTATVSGGSMVHSLAINGFFQDDWRATSKLVLNFGIRYDYQSIPWEKSNGFSTLRLAQVNPVTGLQGTEVYAGVNNGPRNFAAENYHDVGPRVGFAYMISQKHHTVVRGGYALYYASAANIVYANATDEFGISTTSYAAQNTFNYISQFQTGLPYAPNGLAGSSAGPSALLGQSATVQPATAPTSASQQFALSLDHQFTRNTVVHLSVTQNHGTHFPMTALNLNQLNPQYFALGAQLNTITSNPYANDGIKGTLGGKTMTVLQKLKPYPYFQNVYDFYPHIGSFLGRAAQIGIQRPISSSLQLQMTYSLSKLLSDPLIGSLTAGASVASQLQNNYSAHSEYGIDNTDVTHRFSGNLTYVLPFGRSRTFLSHASVGLNRLVGGWNLAGTVTAESGRPLAITGGNGNTATRPSFVPGQSLKVAHPNSSAWFNTAAFTVAPDFTFGNVPRTLSQVRGPGALNINLNLTKQIKFERYSGEFQISGFNVINKTNLGSPNTSYSYVAPTTPSTTPFGSITSALQPRSLLATVRLRF